MIRTVVRVAIQFTTPFLIGSGRGDAEADEVFVADASGLPALPGTTICGVLREAYRHLSSTARGNQLPEENVLFGFQGAATASKDSLGSAIRFSWGAIHDKDNSPVEGLRVDLSGDQVLALARAGVHRHHVRLSHHGVADGRCKFDVEQVASGHRFSFEMTLDDDRGTLTDGLDALVGLLSSGQIALGSGRGTGLGRFDIVRLHRVSFDISTPEGYRRMSELPSGLGDYEGMSVIARGRDIGDPGLLRIELPVSPRGLWFVGSGEADPDNASGADMVPLREDYVCWDTTGGTVGRRRLVIPGSAVRGPLRHRVAYHYNRLTRVWAETVPDGELPQRRGEENAAVREFFGAVASTLQSEQEGQRGLVRIADVHVEEPGGYDVVLPHVGLDRFTSGSVDGVLFTEKARAEDKFTIVVEVDLRGRSLDDTSSRSLILALEDLVQGRLSIGAGSGRGNGFLELQPGRSIVVQNAPPSWPAEVLRV